MLSFGRRHLSVVTTRALLALLSLIVLLAPGCQCQHERHVESGPRAIDEVPEDAVFYLNDHRGTPVVVTNARGEVVREIEFTPYGATVEERGVPDLHGYLGKERDRGSGLNDLGARPYRPEAGIFLSPDPVAVFEPERLLDTPGAFAPYTYSAGDPVNLKDATGRMPTNAYEYISENLIGPKLPPAAKAAVDANRPKGWWGAAEVLSYASMARAGVGIARYAARLATSATARQAAVQTGRSGLEALKAKAAEAKAKLARYVQRAKSTPRSGTETVQRVMSRAEVEATRQTGLVRGGWKGKHHVTTNASTDARRAQQRLSLEKAPEVRATLEVPPGRFSRATRVPPDNGMPGGGWERTATGPVPTRVLRVEDMK